MTRPALRVLSLAACGLCAALSLAPPAQAQYLMPYAPPALMPPGFVEEHAEPYHRRGHHGRREARQGMGPGQVVHLLRERHGFQEIGRPERDGPVYLVQGIDRRGLAVAVVIDAFDGEILSRDRIAGRPAPRPPAEPGGLRPDARTEAGKAVTLPPARPSTLMAPQGMAQAPVAAAKPLEPALAYPPPADARLAAKLGAK